MRNLKTKLKHLEYSSRKSGMTVVELMVVLAIFMLITGLTIFDYGRFRSSVSLQNLADDIALSIRRTQSYAIGVQGSLNSFSNGFGIHFSTLAPSDVALAGSNKSFIIFSDIADKDGYQNKVYDYRISDTSVCDKSTLAFGNECIDLLKINSSDEIVSLCPNSSKNPEDCTTKGYADIVFLRPNPNAHICVSNVGNQSGGIIKGDDEIGGLGDSSIVGLEDIGNGGGGITPRFNCKEPLASLDIVVRNSLSQETRTITVSNVGQISIK